MTRDVTCSVTLLGRKKHEKAMPDEHPLNTSFHWSVLPESTVWKVSKYGVISAPWIPVIGPNTGKYGPEITPYLDIFHAVKTTWNSNSF